ncbi:MAG: class I adenylate-forming enzyme family protein [Pseudomonadota bacterium]
MNLTNIIDWTADPERDAIRFVSAGTGITTISYAQMQGQMGAVAQRFSDVETVGILAENRPEHFLLTLGALAAGTVAVPINHKLPAAAVAHIVEDANVSLTLYDEHLKDKLPRHHIAEKIRALGSAAQAPKALSPEHLAFIMYTSGSTGQPKGVPITHAGYHWAMEQFRFLEDGIRGKMVLIAAPLFHMNAQFHILATLMCGGTAVLMERFEADAFLSAIDAHNVARVTGVPTMFELAVRAIDQGHAVQTHRVTSVAMGSAPLSQTLLDRLKKHFPNAAISNGYGTTETGPAVFGVHPEGKAAPPLSIGYPMDGAQVRLVGPEAPQRGTLQVKSPMTLAAYHKLPKASAAKIKDGWYDTGDVMQVDEDGFYLFAERADDMFVCGGENIYPAQVETLLEQHPGVEQACVVDIPDAIKGAIPVAFIVGSADAAALKNHTLKNGPAYAHPRFIAHLSALPLSGVNKIDRAALKADARTRFEGMRP